MSIYKRGSVWWASWYDRDGKRRRVSLGKMSRDEARTVAAGLAAATRATTFDRAVEVLRLFFADDATGDGQGRAGLADAVPMGEAWAVYERTLRAVGRDGVAASTLAHRRQYLALFAAWLAEARPAVTAAGMVDGPTAAAYAAHLAEATRADGRRLSPKTRRDHLSELGGIWRMLAKADGRVRAEVWAGLAPSGSGDGGERREAFTREQEAAVMAAARRVGKGWPLACLIARHTGLRYGDVARLEWRAVDLAAGVIRMTPSKTRRHGVAVAIPMVRELRDALAEERARVGEAATRAEGALVLPNHAAAQAAGRWAASKQLPFREVLDAAGLGDEAAAGRLTFHSWRHTAATRLAAAGADEATRRAILGHTTAAMAARYDHDAHLAERLAVLERAATGATGA